MREKIKILVFSVGQSCACPCCVSILSLPSQVGVPQWGPAGDMLAIWPRSGHKVLVAFDGASAALSQSTDQAPTFADELCDEFRATSFVFYLEF